MSVVKLRLLLMGTLNKTVMKCRSFHSMQHHNVKFPLPNLPLLYDNTLL